MPHDSGTLPYPSPLIKDVIKGDGELRLAGSEWSAPMRV